MTESDYLDKRRNYELSEAPYEVKQAAIEALDAQWIAQHEAIAAEGDIDDFN